MIGELIANLGIAGVLAWYLWYSTKQNTKREIRDEKREEKILNIVDTSLKDMEKTVSQDSRNTADLKDVISNHLVHSVNSLTTEIRKMNKK